MGKQNKHPRAAETAAPVTLKEEIIEAEGEELIIRDKVSGSMAIISKAFSKGQAPTTGQAGQVQPLSTSPAPFSSVILSNPISLSILIIGVGSNVCININPPSS